MLDLEAHHYTLRQENVTKIFQVIYVEIRFRFLLLIFLENRGLVTDLMGDNGGWNGQAEKLKILPISHHGPWL